MTHHMCRCGHGRGAHEHYTADTHCVLCLCGKFRPRRWWHR
jgi:hypothetical protein